MQYKATEFQSPHQAVEHAVAAGGCAIRLDGKNLAVTKVEAGRLIDEGVEFAFLADRNGTIVTIPVND